jgi:hypothetical protein
MKSLKHLVPIYKELKMNKIGEGYEKDCSLIELPVLFYYVFQTANERDGV